MTKHQTCPGCQGDFVGPDSGIGHNLCQACEPDSKHCDPRDGVVENLIHGLTTEGAHHKQWYLEQAFRALCEDDYVDKAKREFDWDDGIPG